MFRDFVSGDADKFSNYKLMNSKQEPSFLDSFKPKLSAFLKQPFRPSFSELQEDAEMAFQSLDFEMVKKKDTIDEKAGFVR